MNFLKSIITFIIMILMVVIVVNSFFIPNDYPTQIVNIKANCKEKKDLSCEALKKITAQESLPKTDVIIVISGGDTKARTLYGVKLYKLGVANEIILSGAARDSNSQSNAEEMAEIATKEGLPSSQLLVDPKAKNTYENAQNLKNIMELKKYKSVTLVTNSYHQRRANLEFKRAFGENVKIYNAPIFEDKMWSKYTWWLRPYNLLIGLQEVVGYLLIVLGLK